MTTSRRILVAALVAAAFAAACKDHETVRVNATNATIARRDSAARPVGPGDIRIATTDSVIELGLVGDSLVAGFGAATREKIKRATDTATVTGSGLGASIERIVKSSVAGALDHEVHVPLTEISDVQYEDGLLVFYGRDGKRKDFIDRKGNDGRSSRFSDADAQDFIAIFRAKTRSR